MHKWLKFGDLEVKAKTRFPFTTPVPKCREGEGSEGKKTTTTCSVYAREGEMGKSSVAPTISEVNQFRSEVNETTSEVNESVSDVVGTTSSFEQAMMRNKALPLETKC